MILTHQSPLFICFRIWFTFWEDIFACAKNSMVSLTLESSYRLSHWHRGVKLSSDIDTVESSSVVTLTPWSPAMGWVIDTVESSYRLSHWHRGVKLSSDIDTVESSYRLSHWHRGVKLGSDIDTEDSKIIFVIILRFFFLSIMKGCFTKCSTLYFH